VEVLGSIHQLSVAVADIVGNVPGFAELLNTRVFYNFDFTMSLVGIGTSSDYDQAASRLFKNSRISKMPDHQYREEYKKSIKYWNGETWQIDRSENRRYEEALVTQVDTMRVLRIP